MSTRTSKVPSGVAISAGAGRSKGKGRPPPKIHSPAAAPAIAAAAAAVSGLVSLAVWDQRGIDVTEVSGSVHACVLSLSLLEFGVSAFLDQPWMNPARLTTPTAADGTLSLVAHGGLLRPARGLFFKFHPPSPLEDPLLRVVSARTKRTNCTERSEGRGGVHSPCFFPDFEAPALLLGGT